MTPKQLSKSQKNFIVIDTEGKYILTELAVIDSDGETIYEAFVADELNSEGRKLNVKSLKEIVEDFANLAKSKLIICHYAEHDIEVLYKSFTKAKVKWPNLKFGCTYEIAKQNFPNLEGYSLEYLSKHFHLQVDEQRFNHNQAHGAKYDALFTHKLYLNMTSATNLVVDKPNPFGTSRVDTPFQQHIDLKLIYQHEFSILTSIITEIKHDSNQQSRGAIVIGEAGNGKTHLMMRLANETLQNNRLLFIRQPNNPKSVLHHIYSRILESFVEIIPDSQYSQLEYLLAKSFSKILINELKKRPKLTKKAETILKSLLDNPLNIYNQLGSENTNQKRKNWQFIEKSTLDWWGRTYGFGGYSIAIVRGLIKFCSYSDLYRRESVKKWLSGNQLEANELAKVNLENWGENISQEEFSLEAISVFGRLSIVDEPLIIVFDQLEGLKYHEQLLLNFGEAIKEIFTHTPNSLIILNLFPDRWQHFKSIFNAAVIDRISQYEVTLAKLTDKQLKQILNLKAQEYDIETLFTPDELHTILAQNSIRGVLNWASHYYRFKFENIPLPQNTKSFEAEIREDLQLIKNDIIQLKRYIGMIEPSVANPPSIQNSISEKPEKYSATPTELQTYFKQQKVNLEREYHKNVIISDFDDIGKVITITGAFKPFRQLEIDQLRLGKKAIPEHIFIKNKSQVIGFLHTSGAGFTARMKNFNQLVINNKNIDFKLFRDARETNITGKIGKEEIEKLNNANNGQFIVMEQQNRVSFELIYKTVLDIQNKDVEINLATAMNGLQNFMENHWLIKCM
ncbi:3'-5' exonuclease [Candidatus Halobeggiatoa sp. HSG11]|nr:3'-5' exonuclease [Candidatus Halobeggiatoa sp. HSG11]